MEKVNYNNINTFMATYKCDDSEKNFEEWLYLYIKYISSIKYMKNILKSILPYDKSLEMEDLINTLYEKALIYHKKGKNDNYVYSLYTFKFDVSKLCSHYKSTKKGLYEKISFSEEIHDNFIEDLKLKYIHEYYVILGSLNEDEYTLLINYFEKGYTYNEIGKMLNISHAGAKYKIDKIIKKLKDAL